MYLCGGNERLKMLRKLNFIENLEIFVLSNNSLCDETNKNMFSDLVKELFPLATILCSNTSKGITKADRINDYENDLCII